MIFIRCEGIGKLGCFCFQLVDCLDMRIDVVDRVILLDKVIMKLRVVEDVILIMKKDIYKKDDCNGGKLFDSSFEYLDRYVLYKFLD